MIRLNLESSPTATDLISTATAKEFLRVTHSNDDTLIASMIAGAIEVAQNFTNRKFLEYEYKLVMATWDDVYVSNSYSGNLYRDVATSLSSYGGYYSRWTGLQQIQFPYPPLISVTHVKYYDTSDSETTWNSSNYNVGKFMNQKGFIEIKDGVSTPSLYKRDDAIEIQFKCGYGTSSSDVPDAIKQAILLIVGKMYELREDSVSRLPKASEYILEPYRIKTY